MKIDLSTEELEMVESWYQSAAGESCTQGNSVEEYEKLRSLLRKFGFEPHYMDEHFIQ